MEVFNKIRDKVIDFWDNSSSLTKTVVLILMFLIVTSLIALPFSIKITKKKNTTIPYASKVVPVQDFFPPEDVPLTQDYYFERPQDKEWSEEDTKQWFTMPDQNSVNELGKQNDKLVNEITGAAP